MSKSLRQTDSGQALVLFALTLSIIVSICAFAVDLIPAYQLSANQSNMLELSKEECVRALNYLKFSQTPESDMSDKVIIDMLIKSGYVGTATVYYYEEPAVVNDLNERVIVIRVDLNQDYKTSLGRVMGITNIPVSTHIVWLSKPYSSREVWTPSGKHNVKLVYDIKNNASSLVSRSSIVNENALPDDMRKALNDGKTSDDL